MTYLSLFGVVGWIYLVFQALGNWVLDKWHTRSICIIHMMIILTLLIFTTRIVLSCSDHQQLGIHIVAEASPLLLQ